MYKIKLFPALLRPSSIPTKETAPILLKNEPSMHFSYAYPRQNTTFFIESEKKKWKSFGGYEKSTKFAAEKV